MFPIPSSSLLQLSLIADYWSRESQPRANKRETVTELFRAWWRGELVGIGPRRVDVLRGLFQMSQDYIAFNVPGQEVPPTLVLADDGSATIIRPVTVPLPNFDSDKWDDVSCMPAYSALADQWHRLVGDDAEPAISSTKLTRDEFFKWLRKRGNRLPIFWGDLAPGAAKEVLNKRRPGPRSRQAEMRDALIKLGEKGQRFNTSGAAHRAVLAHLGITGAAPRGMSYETFRKMQRQILDS